jgi:hypothetical protein
MRVVHRASNGCTTLVKRNSCTNDKGTEMRWHFRRWAVHGRINLYESESLAKSGRTSAVRSHVESQRRGPPQMTSKSHGERHTICLPPSITSDLGTPEEHRCTKDLNCTNLTHSEAPISVIACKIDRNLSASRLYLKRYHGRVAIVLIQRKRWHQTHHFPKLTRSPHIHTSHSTDIDSCAVNTDMQQSAPMWSAEPLARSALSLGKAHEQGFGSLKRCVVPVRQLHDISVAQHQQSAGSQNEHRLRRSPGGPPSHQKWSPPFRRHGGPFCWF